MPVCGKGGALGLTGSSTELLQPRSPRAFLSPQHQPLPSTGVDAALQAHTSRGQYEADNAAAAFSRRLLRTTRRRKPPSPPPAETPEEGGPPSAPPKPPYRGRRRKPPPEGLSPSPPPPVSSPSSGLGPIGGRSLSDPPRPSPPPPSPPPPNPPPPSPPPPSPPLPSPPSPPPPPPPTSPPPPRAPLAKPNVLFNAINWPYPYGQLKNYSKADPTIGKGMDVWIIAGGPPLRSLSSRPALSRRHRSPGTRHPRQASC
jgi:hypothetical protein